MKIIRTHTSVAKCSLEQNRSIARAGERCNATGWVGGTRYFRRQSHEQKLVHDIGIFKNTKFWFTVNVSST